MSLVTPLALSHLSAEFGAKAASLAQLHGVAAVRVPPGFAVSHLLFRQVIERTLTPTQWPERLIEGPRTAWSPEALKQIRQQILAAPVPAKAWSEVLLAYRTLRCECVAVRSSATHEDGGAYSGAGIFETALGVTSEEQLETAVRAAFCALFTTKALEYLVQLKPKEPPAIALIVQRVVQADCAGVLFTEDPIRREAGLMRIEAAIGLGVSVVDGSVQPDIFLIGRNSAEIVDQQIAEKTSFVQVNPAGGVRTVSLERTSRPAIDETQIAELVAAGRAVERALGGGRDIEFCFEGSTLWIVQARPIVVAPEPDDERSKWVWSNVNVGEALPGVPTPLTWSIASAFSDLGFRRAFSTLGCVVPEGAQLVGRFHGRIYLNLTHFFSIASQVPALDPKMLLEFGGGGGVDEVARQLQSGSWAKFAFRAPGVIAKFIAENATLDATLKTFDAEFESFRRGFLDRDWRSLTRAALSVEFERLHSLLDRTGALMLTCASGSLSSTLLVRLFLERTVGKELAQRYSHELLTGNGDNESAQPGLALAHLALSIENNPAAKQLLCGDRSVSLQIADFAGNAIYPQVASFFHAYGYRAVREAELATPRWHEDPAFVFAALRAQLGGGAQRALLRIDEQAKVRERAQSHWVSTLSPILQPLARHALGRARKFLRLRERMRARVTEVLGFFRALALEISRRLRELYPELASDAVFFLDVDDLREFLRGGALDVVHVIGARRATHLRDVSRPDPPNSFVGAPPAPTAPVIAPSQDHWVGVGASPGLVKGRVRIVKDPKDGEALEPGEILAVRVADVGWTPLFLVAAGVITELGGALSHASLVAREYGVPAVVNLAGILEVLRDGDVVAVDGSSGIVTREVPPQLDPT